MLDLISELWAFILTRKKYWMAPLLILMFLAGSLIILTQGSAIAPFIYTLF